MEKPDIKVQALKVAEVTAMAVIDEIVAPFAKYYASSNGLNLDGFISDLLEKVKADYVDQIDEVDQIPGEPV